MQMFEASLQWRLVQLGESQQLKTPRQIVAYMLGAFTHCATEQSLWLINFSVNRWVIGRTCLKVGPLVTACPHLREVLRIAILADARGIAVVRGEPTGQFAPDAGDRRLAKSLCDAAGATEIEWIDYLIVSTRDDAEKPEYHSLWEHE
jgi:DNA repair protein RadC